MEKNELLFAKTKEGAIIPTKRDEDGCYDLYPCFDDLFIAIQPHENKLIDTGIATAFDKKWRLAIRERGSNTKSNMIVMAGQIDSGYRGSIFVSIYNGNDIPIEISKMAKEVEVTKDFISVPYTKAIAQFAMEEVPTMKEKVVSYEELKSQNSERGCGKLGSSSK